MRKKEDNYKWHCVICEKEMGIDPGDRPGCLSPASWPNITGGTFSLDFGWGSKHDDTNLHDHKEWQGCMCDECFSEKRHLMRHIREQSLGNEWIIISEEDEDG